MLADLPLWCGDIHEVMPLPFVGGIVTITSVLCGAAVGMERQRRDKPVGLRTMMLICLGACIFTQMSLLIATPWADPGRIAAQIVTGVGFLGAGAIIRERGMLIGVTTGAAIWAVAAIGLTVGAGYIVPGLFFTILAVLTLSTERLLEKVVVGRCQWAKVRIEYDPSDGKTRPLIQAVLDDHQVSDSMTAYSISPGGRETVSIRYCNRHRHHRIFLSQIAMIPSVDRIHHEDGHTSG
jgi:putative Mg2+ transporter-C (MgtC) family protein